MPRCHDRLSKPEPGLPHLYARITKMESVMRPYHPFGILSGLILLGTAALSSTAAIAAEEVQIQTKSVSYVQADLQDEASAGALYHRIQRAARFVCQQP